MKQVFGTRKTSVAVILLRDNGGLTVNGKDIQEYFVQQRLISDALKSIILLNTSVNAEIRVHGGGLSSQAGAVRYALSRLLALQSEENKEKLSKTNLLRCDTRQVERKKIGRYKSRKKFPYNRR